MIFVCRELISTLIMRSGAKGRRRDSRSSTDILRTGTSTEKKSYQTLWLVIESPLYEWESVEDLTHRQKKMFPFKKLIRRDGWMIVFFCNRFQSTLFHLSILASSQFHMLVAMKEVPILWRLYYCIKYKVVQSVKRIFSSIVFLFLEGASNIILRESGGVLKVEHFKLLNQLKSLLVLLIGDLGARKLPVAH